MLFILLYALSIRKLSIVFVTVRVSYPIGRSEHSHLGIVLDLSRGAPGFDFSQEVVLKSKMNWRAVRSDVALGMSLSAAVMVDVLDAELGRMGRTRASPIKITGQSGDKPRFD